MFLEALISIETKIGAASWVSVPVEAASPAPPAISEDIRASTGSSRPHHPASPVAAARPTIPVDGVGTPLRSRHRTMTCPICRRLPPGRTLPRQEALTAATIPMIPTRLAPANHAANMSGPLPWGVRRVAVGTPASPAAMSLAIHGDRASRHDLPAPPTIIAASRE